MSSREKAALFGGWDFTTKVSTSGRLQSKLMELLKHKGEASEEQIAKAILDFDPVQKKYYEDKVRNMVGKVLKKNGITERQKSTHSLLGYEELTSEQVQELIELLDNKLSEEVNARGDEFWKHRATDREEISGSVRYEVLKRAKGRCECCGVSKEDRPLDVDHIIPVSKKGKNEISNYQALCWLCNTNKGNRDKTDFRNLENFYAERTKDCLFCDVQTIDRKRIIAENSLAYRGFESLLLRQIPIKYAPPGAYFVSTHQFTHHQVQG